MSAFAKQSKNNPMKIALAFHRLGPYHYARIHAAAKQGNAVAIEYTLKDETYAWDIVEAEGGLQRITLFEEHGTHETASEIGKRIRSALERLGPDVVAIPGWGSRWALAILDACLKSRTPAVLMSDSTYHDARRRWWAEAAKQRIVRLFSSALVGGQANAEYLRILGFRDRPILHGYDVVDNGHFAAGADNSRRESDRFRKGMGLSDRFFLASGRMVEKKNHFGLLEAYTIYRKRAGDSAWGLVLLGNGPLRKEIESSIRRLGLSGHVVLPGFRQYDELPIYYGLAEAFVHPSTVEQWGLVVNEAMAAGLPVLVSRRCGCAPDLVREGRNGFTFDPLDVHELAALMKRMSAESCDRKAMGTASREIIAQWSPELFGENLWEAAEIAREKGSPRYRALDRFLLESLIRIL
jgi:glycosyltransferase involved in cell wall biosynthesis